jgi:hypothetical protein
VSEKKKIGIVTLHGYFNYGNRLQNYAAEQVLQSMGFEVETIRNESPKTEYSFSKKVINLLKNNPKEIVKKTKNKLISKKENNKTLKFDKEKKEKFLSFSGEYLNESDFVISENSIPTNLNNDYDFFITGSDQVWNPTIASSSSLHFLLFAPSSKRISFSPSFGISEIPDKYKGNFKTWLNEMKSLSVRENEGADIIKRLTGRNSEVLVDPTMMLNKKEWQAISKEYSKKPKKDFLFTYILGDLSNKKEKTIKRMAETNNLEIVNLADKKNLNYYTSGPREFLDFINSASLVLTDSFHASIFSIIFNTPFIVFDRVDNNLSMNSRINTLLGKFNLMSRYNLSLKSSNEEIFNIDFTKTDEILGQERKKVINYLNSALEINN